MLHKHIAYLLTLLLLSLSVFTHAQTRLPAQEIQFQPSNAGPGGIWSDGTTIWVGDTGQDRMYAYTLRTGARDTSKEFDLTAANSGPREIWSDDTTMWVLDGTDDRIYAYALSTGAHDAGKEFDLSAENNDPWGIWSDGITMWVSDFTDDRIYAYALSTGARDTSKEFDLHADNGASRGLWSDGTTLWVADFNNDRMYAYTLSTGARDENRDFALERENGTPFYLGSPHEIWSDGTTMWVLDSFGGRIYAYTLKGGMRGAREEDREIALYREPEEPLDVWSDDTTMWLIDDRSVRIFAYSLAGGAIDTSREFFLPVTNSQPRGIWSDGTTMWVTDRDDDRLYAYTLSTGARNASREFELHAENGAPRSMWSDGTTLWVVDSVVDRVFAYTLASGARDTGSEFAMDTDNSVPIGIWSDGTTMWVSDITDAHIYAYTLEGGARDTSREFALDAANSKPFGIWSDGTTLWVTDRDDDRIYAYTLSGGTPPNSPSSPSLAEVTAVPTPTADTTPEYTFSSSESGTISYSGACSLTTGTAPVAVALSGTNTITFGPLADGDYADCTITVTDTAGNASEPLAVTAFTVDTTAPSLAEVTAVPTPTAVTTPEYTFSSSESGNISYAGACSLTTGTAPVAVALSGANTITFGPLADGDYADCTITVTDTAGNASEPLAVTAFTVDTTAPSLAEVTAVPTPTTDTTPEYTFSSSEAGAISYNGTCESSTTATTEGDNTITFNTLVEGEHTDCTIIVTDAAGNASEPLAVTAFTIEIETISVMGIQLHRSNSLAHGIWSDGTTMWVADRDANRIYAYTLSTGARDMTKEFVPDAANSQPTHIWSDGTTMWVTDNNDDQLYAYTLSTGARDTSREFNFTSENFNNVATGIWSDGTTIWVADLFDDKLYAYTLSTGARDADKEFDTNERPEGLWSDGTTMWVSDYTNARIYAYTLASGARDMGREIVPNNNSTAIGLWSDGTTLWVVDIVTNRIYTYPLPGVTSPSLPILAEVTAVPTPTMDLTPEYTFSSDKAGTISYSGACSLTTGTAPVAVALSGTNTITFGPLADGDYTDCTITVTDTADNTSEPLMVTAFTVDSTVPSLAEVTAVPTPTTDTTPEYVFSSSEAGIIRYAGACSLTTGTAPVAVALSGTNTVTFGPLADGDYTDCTITVTDTAGNASEPLAVTAFTIEIDTIPAMDIRFHSSNDRARGIWSDGTTMWVADGLALRIFAYTLSTGARDEDSEFDLTSRNGDPYGIWSDGTTLWVADTTDFRLYAYTLSTGVRDTSREFNLIRANVTPLGIWSDGTTMWASDLFADKLYAYTLSTGARDADRDFDSNNRPQGIWSDGTTMWVGDERGNRIYAYTLASGVRDMDREIVPNNNSSPTGLWSDGTTLWVADSSADRIFTYPLPGSTPTSSPSSPSLTEVTAVPTPTTDTTPEYVFSSSEAGIISYGGACSLTTGTAPVAVALSGTNTITFGPLADGDYADCTITVTDTADNTSEPLMVTAFTVDSTVPSLAEVTAVPTPTTDTTPEYTFVSSEAGTISYGGACSLTTGTAPVAVALSGTNTITFGPLADGDYADCTITVTDTVDNTSLPLAVTPFTVDTTVPSLAEVTAVPTPTTDTTPEYVFSSSEAGIISYAGACSLTTGTAPVAVALSGTNTITFGPLADGDYADCTITVTDAADNTSEPLAATAFTVDTTAPSLAEVTAVPTPTTDTTPEYTFSSSEAGIISYAGACSLTTGTAPVAVALSGTNTVTFGHLADGDYTDCTITVTDTAGNASEPLAVTAFTVDTTAPSLAEVIAVPTPTADTTPEYVFSSDAAGTISYAGACSLTTGTAPVAVALSGTNTITFGPLADGDYADCTITVTDTADNTSEPLMVTAFTVDSTVPSLAEVTAVPTPTADTAPEYVFSSSEAGIISYAGACSLTTGTAPVAVALSGTNTVTFGPLADGDYTDCTITVTDTADNTSEPLMVTAFTVDSTVPSLAEVTAVPTPTTDTTPEYVFSSDEVGTISYAGGCASSTTDAIIGDNTISFDALADGDYACSITVTDVAGNASNTLAVTPFTVDTTVPSLAEVTAVPTPTMDTTPEYVFSSDAAGTISYAGACSLTTGTAPVAVALSGTNTITFGPLADGDYADCTITVTDTADNTSEPLAVTAFTIDSTAPSLAEITAVPTPTMDTTPEYVFSSDAAGIISYAGACSLTTGTAPVAVALSGTNTITFGPLADGDYTDCTITVTDAADNASEPLMVTAFTVDSTAPSLAEVTAVPTPTTDTTPEYTFSSSEAGTISYGGVCVSSITDAIEGNNTISFNTLAEGEYTDCTITVTDTAGNASEPLAATAFTVDTTAPSLAEVTAVPTPTTDTTPEYTFSSSDAGTISYAGVCVSSITDAIEGNNTISFNTLAEGEYTDCTITVTDTAGNASEPLAATAFTVETIILAMDIEFQDSNTDPRDTWSNGTTLWLADSDADRIFAYTLSTGMRDATKEFDLHRVNGSARGIWSDGTTMWVADSSDERLYAYTLSTGVRDTTKEFDLNVANSNSENIWSNGTTMWVLDSSDDRIYAYTLAGGARDMAKEFDLDAANYVPRGIWSDGTTMWVGDTGADRLYAYTLGTGARDMAKEFALDPANDTPQSIWSNGTTIWVVNFNGDRIFAYNLAGGARNMGSEFNLYRDSRSSEGIWSDGTTIWVADSEDDQIYAYALVGGGRDTDSEFDLNIANAAATGIWSDGTTLWVADENDGRIYAYVLSTGMRDTSSEFALTAANGDAWGIWSDGTTLWVVDSDADRVFAYTLAGGVRDTSKEFALPAANGNARGLWSDGTTMWVADKNDGRIYAYVLSTGMRDTSSEFALTAANGDARGIWSDGTTMWVTDNIDTRIYTYTLPAGAAPSIPRLAEVTAVPTPTTDTTPEYVFSSDAAGTISYAGACSLTTGTAPVAVALSGTNTITFGPLADGDYTDCTITVTDTAGNASEPLAVTAFTVDNTAPTVTISNASGTTSGAFTVNIDFSEDVTDFAAIDIAAGNGEVSNLDGSGASYTATITPAGGLSDGAIITINIAAGVAMDLAGNGNEVAIQATVSFTPADNTAPQVESISRMEPSAEDTNADTLTWAVVFSEAVSNVDANDFAVSNTTATITVAGSDGDISYQVTASGGDLDALDATVSLSIGSGHDITDIASNALTDTAPTTGANESYTIDNTAPTIVNLITVTPREAVTNADTLVWSIFFTEGVNNVGATNFSLSNTDAEISVSPLNSGGRLYLITASGGDLAELNATVVFSIVSDNITNINDNAGNSLVANFITTETFSNLSYTIDNTAPTVTISNASGTTSGAFTVNIDFSEDVTDFAAIDIVVGNGEVSNLDGSGSSYTATITPASGLSDGAIITINIAAGVAMDLAGNGNEAATQATVSFTQAGNTAPQVESISRMTPLDEITNADTLTWAVVFSEAVSNVDANDFAVSNTTATITVAGSDGDISYQVTASGGDLDALDATVSLSIGSGHDITDIASNALTDTAPTGANESYTIDNTAPTIVTVSAISPREDVTNADTLVWSIFFNEGVNNVGAANFSLSNTDAEISVSPLNSGGRLYLITASGGDLAELNATVAFSIVSDNITNITDNAGNSLVANFITTETFSSIGYTIDNTAPILSETTAITTPTSDITPEYTFSSSEAGTISYAGGCTSSTTAATVGSTTITFDPLVDGTYSDCTITLTDAASNVSEPLTVTTFTISITPNLAEITAVPTPTTDTTPEYTFSSDEAGTISYAGGCTSSTTNATVGNNTITFNTLAEGEYAGCTITVTNGFGNASEPLAVTAFTVDTIPAVESITTTTAAGSYGIGEVIVIEVVFTETVVVTGSPVLSLNNAGQAIYSTGSNSDTLTFKYTVSAGQGTANLDYSDTNALSLAGGNINDPTGNPAILTLSDPAADGLRNNVAELIIINAPGVIQVSGANYNYIVGDVVTVRVQFSEAVAVSGGELQLELEMGDPDKMAVFSMQTTTAIMDDTLDFTYTVEEGDRSEDLGYTSVDALVARGATRVTSATSSEVAGLTLPDLGSSTSLSGSSDMRVGIEEQNARLNKMLLPKMAQAISTVTVEAITHRIEASSGDEQASLSSSLSAILPAGLPALKDMDLSWLKSFAYDFFMSKAEQSARNGSIDLDVLGSGFDIQHTLKRMLGDSEFVMPLNASGEGDNTGSGATSSMVLWGSGNYSNLSDNDNGLDYDGDIYSINLGIDSQISRETLLGISVNWSNSDFDYRDATTAQSGDYGYRLYGINPYISWSPHGLGGANLWATLGYGIGEIESQIEGIEKIETDTKQYQFSGGGRYILSSSADRLSQLSIKGDVTLLRVDIDQSVGFLGNDIDSQSFRLLLQGSSVFNHDGYSFTPSLEGGLRYDLGDGDTGGGIELSPAFTYKSLDDHVLIEGRGRYLVAGQYDQWGLSVLARIDMERHGRGLSFSMHPTWGQSQAQAEQLTAHNSSRFNDYRAAKAEAQIKTELSYGMRSSHILGQTMLLTPYAEFTLGENARYYQFGQRLSIGELLSLSFKLDHHQRRGYADDNHIGLESTINF